MGINTYFNHFHSIHSEIIHIIIICQWKLQRSSYCLESSLFPVCLMFCHGMCAFRIGVFFFQICVATWIPLFGRNVFFCVCF